MSPIFERLATNYPALFPTSPKGEARGYQVFTSPVSGSDLPHLIKSRQTFSAALTDVCEVLCEPLGVLTGRLGQKSEVTLKLDPDGPSAAAFVGDAELPILMVRPMYEKGIGRPTNVSQGKLPPGRPFCTGWSSMRNRELKLPSTHAQLIAGWGFLSAHAGTRQRIARFSLVANQDKVRRNDNKMHAWVFTNVENEVVLTIDFTVVVTGQRMGFARNTRLTDEICINYGFPLLTPELIAALPPEVSMVYYATRQIPEPPHLHLMTTLPPEGAYRALAVVRRIDLEGAVPEQSEAQLAQFDKSLRACLSTQEYEKLAAAVPTLPSEVPVNGHLADALMELHNPALRSKPNSRTKKRRPV